MPGMTQKEYAEHRGVKPPHINRLVKAGKIPLRADGTINPADADFALDKDRARVNTPAPRAPSAPGDGRGLTQARTATEVYKARMARLQYEERLGKVLPLDGVVDAAATCGETVVRLVRSVSMHADVLSAASARAGVAGLRVALKGIERELCTRIAGAFSKMAAEATAAREPEPASDAVDDAED